MNHLGARCSPATGIDAPQTHTSAGADEFSRLENLGKTLLWHSGAGNLSRRAGDCKSGFPVAGELSAIKIATGDSSLGMLVLNFNQPEKQTMTGDLPAQSQASPPLPTTGTTATASASWDWWNNRIVSGLLLAGVAFFAAQSWSVYSQVQRLELEKSHMADAVEDLKKDLSEYRIAQEALKTTLQSTAATTAANASDLITVKSQTAQSDQNVGTFQTAINSVYSQIAELKNIREFISEDLTSVRERVGKLEGYQEAKKEAVK